MGTIKSPILISTGNIDTDGSYRLIGGGSNTTGRAQVRAASDEFGGASIQLGYFNKSETQFYPYTDESGAAYAAYTAPFSVSLDAGRHSKAAFLLSGFSPTTVIELEVTELS